MRHRLFEGRIYIVGFPGVGRLHWVSPGGAFERVPFRSLSRKGLTLKMDRNMCTRTGSADRPTLCGCTYSGPFSGLILSLTVTGMARVQKRRPERPNAAVPHLETRRYISAPRRAGGAWRCVEG